MAATWTIAEERRVEVDPRLLKMESAQAVRSVVEALVELVTNADDAYQSQGDEIGKIIIEVTRRRREDSSGEVVVKDRAGGMTLAEMEHGILKYGSFSAKDASRGFMGRGAKDIVSLGNASFISVKNGRTCRVDITPDFHCKIYKEHDASEADLKALGLKAGKGGLMAQLVVSKDHRVPQHENLRRDLQRHYALRRLLQRREVRLSDGTGNQADVLRYVKPEGELVLQETREFSSPYEGAVAKLTLYRSQSELDTDLNEGVLVCDRNAAHQATRFSEEMNQDPVARRFFGTLECEYIRTLQLEFEGLRKQGKPPVQHNPVDVVDPHRRRGLDRDGHPFIRQLFDWAEGVLRRVVDEIKSEERPKQREVANDTTKKKLHELSRAVAEHLRNRLDEEMLGPRTPEQNAALQKEGVLLNPQFVRIAVGETKRLGYTILSFGQEQDPTHINVEVDSDAISISPQRPALRPQQRDPDRLTAYFELQGVKPAQSVNLLVRNPNELIPPVERRLEVVPPDDPYKNLPAGLFFEQQQYTVHDNGTRTIGFIAKGKRFRQVDWKQRNLVESSDPAAIAILKGNVITVNNVGKDVWKGELQVRGQGIGQRGRITITVTSRDGNETSYCSVEVVGKQEPPSISIEIDIVPEQGGQWRAQWDRQRPGRLKVFSQHPTLARYLGSQQEGYPGQEAPHFRVLLAEIVADKVVQRIFEEKLASNPGLYQDSSTFFFKYTEEMTAFLPLAHEIMLSDADTKKLVVKMT